MDERREIRLKTQGTRLKTKNVKGLIKGNVVAEACALTLVPCAFPNSF